MRQLAEALNAAGLDMRKVLKPSIAIPWNRDSVHDQLWVPIQEALFDKRSTTELEKSEVSEVEKVLVRHLSEKFSLECPEWPHMSEEEFLRETLTNN